MAENLIPPHNHIYYDKLEHIAQGDEFFPRVCNLLDEIRDKSLVLKPSYEAERTLNRFKRFLEILESMDVRERILFYKDNIVQDRMLEICNTS